MQHEITERKPLLDKKGCLTEAGFAKNPILNYRRQDIKADRNRIKEWDYYFVGNGKFGIALTIADNSYMGLDSISFLDFEKKCETTKSPMRFFTYGRKKLPETSEKGDVSSFGSEYYIAFKNEGTRRILSFRMGSFSEGRDIAGSIVLQCPKTESMVIATPFSEDRHAFYYNQKINCMPAEGTVVIGDETYRFSPEDSFGVLDWGRGVWTYKNTWYWGSASGLIGGVPFGFNVGYGFGDTSAASENMLFFNGRAHKLSRVKFNIPRKDGKDDFMSPWEFISDDLRFEMKFEPVLDRQAKIDLKLLCSDQHQVFGKFSGRAALDDGSVLHINNLFGFAEKVYNKW